MTKKFFWFPEAKFRNPESNDLPKCVREKEKPLVTATIRTIIRHIPNTAEDRRQGYYYSHTGNRARAFYWYQYW